jgi:FkbM family methyltransferase
MGEQFSIDLVRVDHSGCIFFVPKYAVHRPASQEILAGRLFEPKTHSMVRTLLQSRGGNIVHAGTFFGDMLPTFSRACPGTVYAFEPVLENYVLAKLSVEENALNNVILLNAGLGSKVAVARIDTNENGLHRGGSSHIADHGHLTALLTIDSFEIDNLSIIHLDVEGHELEALHGATNTIERNLPIILIEDNENDCPDFLASMDYSRTGEIPGLTIWQAKQLLPRRRP